MILRSPRQLENTSLKLHALEERYRQCKERSAEDARVREFTLLSLKQLINQLTEEIVRFKAGTVRHTRREIESDLELENTKEKLRQLEELFRRDKQPTAGNDRVHKLSRQSLKRLINQLTEDIARYEAHAKVKG